MSPFPDLSCSGSALHCMAGKLAAGAMNSRFRAGIFLGVCCGMVLLAITSMIRGVPQHLLCRGGEGRGGVTLLGLIFHTLLVVAGTTTPACARPCRS